MPNVDPGIVAEAQRRGLLPASVAGMDPALVAEGVSRGIIKLGGVSTPSPYQVQGVQSSSPDEPPVAAPMVDIAGQIGQSQDAFRKVASGAGKALGGIVSQEINNEQNPVMLGRPRTPQTQQEAAAANMAGTAAANTVKGAGNFAASAPDFVAGVMNMGSQEAASGGLKVAGAVNRMRGNVAQAQQEDALRQQVNNQIGEETRLMGAGVVQGLGGAGPTSALGKTFSAVHALGQGDPQAAASFLNDAATTTGRNILKDPFAAAMNLTVAGGLAHAANMAEAGVRGAMMERMAAGLDQAADAAQPYDPVAAAAARAKASDLRTAQGHIAQARAAFEGRQRMAATNEAAANPERGEFVANSSGPLAPNPGGIGTEPIPNPLPKGKGQDPGVPAYGFAGQFAGKAPMPAAPVERLADPGGTGVVAGARYTTLGEEPPSVPPEPTPNPLPKGKGQELAPGGSAGAEGSGPLTPNPGGTGQTPVQARPTQGDFDAAVERLKNGFGDLKSLGARIVKDESGHVDPEALAGSWRDLALAGGFLYDNGLREFGSWRDALQDNLGETLSDDHARQAYTLAQQAAANMPNSSTSGADIGGTYVQGEVAHPYAGSINMTQRALSDQAAARLRDRAMEMGLDRQPVRREADVIDQARQAALTTGDIQNLLPGDKPSGWHGDVWGLALRNLDTFTQEGWADAKAAYEANPTPENREALERAEKDAALTQVHANAWAREAGQGLRSHGIFSWSEKGERARGLLLSAPRIEEGPASQNRTDQSDGTDQTNRTAGTGQTGAEPPSIPPQAEGGRNGARGTSGRASTEGSGPLTPNPGGSRPGNGRGNGGDLPDSGKLLGKIRNQLTADELGDMDRSTAAIKDWLKSLSGVNSVVGGIDPSVLPHLVKVGAYLVKGGARSFAAWAKAFVDTTGVSHFGDTDMQALYARSQAEYRRGVKEAQRPIAKAVFADRLAPALGDRVRAGQFIDQIADQDGTHTILNQLLHDLPLTPEQNAIIDQAWRANKKTIKPEPSTGAMARVQRIAADAAKARADAARVPRGPVQGPPTPLEMLQKSLAGRIGTERAQALIQSLSGDAAGVKVLEKLQNGAGMTDQDNALFATRVNALKSRNKPAEGNIIDQGVKNALNDHRTAVREAEKAASAAKAAADKAAIDPLRTAIAKRIGVEQAKKLLEYAETDPAGKAVLDKIRARLPITDQEAIAFRALVKGFKKTGTPQALTAVDESVAGAIDQAQKAAREAEKAKNAAKVPTAKEDYEASIKAGLGEAKATDFHAEMDAAHPDIVAKIHAGTRLTEAEQKSLGDTYLKHTTASTPVARSGARQEVFDAVKSSRKAAADSKRAAEAASADPVDVALKAHLGEHAGDARTDLESDALGRSAIDKLRSGDEMTPEEERRLGQAVETVRGAKASLPRAAGVAPREDVKAAVKTLRGIVSDVRGGRLGYDSPREYARALLKNAADRPDGTVDQAKAKLVAGKPLTEGEQAALDHHNSMMAELDKIGPHDVKGINEFILRHSATAMENWRHYIQANLLSGPKTIAKILISHGVALTSDELRQFVRNPARSVSGVGAAAGVAFTRGAREAGLTPAQFAEALGHTLRLRSNGPDGLMWHGPGALDLAGLNRFHEMGHMTSTEFTVGRGGPAAGAVNSAVRAPMRVHGALYHMMQTYAVERGLILEAQKMARSEGLSGAEFNRRVGELRTNPPRSMLNKAIDFAKEQTFVNETKGTLPIAGLRKMGAGGEVAANVLFPFARVPINLGGRSAEMASPLVGASQYARALGQYGGHGHIPAEELSNISKSIERGVVGTGLAAAGYALQQHGLAQAPNPQRGNNGTVRAGGTDYDVGGYSPVGTLLNVGSTVGELTHPAPGMPAPTALQNGQRVMNLAGDIPYFRANETLSALTSNDDRGLARAGAGALSMNIPYSAAQSQIESLRDTGVRQKQTMGDYVKNGLFGERQTLPFTKDATNPGHPYPQPGFLNQTPAPSLSQQTRESQMQRRQGMIDARTRFWQAHGFSPNAALVRAHEEMGNANHAGGGGLGGDLGGLSGLGGLKLPGL